MRRIALVLLLAACQPALGRAVDLPAGLATLDADRDGILTRAEWEAGTGPLLAGLDTDRNGVLSAAELSAGVLPLFDKDGDGLLQPAELVRVEMDGDEAREPAAVTGDLAALGLAGWDADGDTALDAKELAAARTAAFDTGDRNVDGRLDRLEIFSKRLRLLVDRRP